MKDRREGVPNHGHSGSSSEQLSSQPSFHTDTHIPCARDRGEPHTHRVRIEPAPNNLTSLRQTRAAQLEEMVSLGLEAENGSRVWAYLSVSLEYLIRFLSGESKDSNFSLRSFPLSLNLPSRSLLSR